MAINEESYKLKKSGKKIYKFGFGQSPFPIPDSIISALKNNANKNTYLPMQGLEELRLAIANHLNKNNNNDFKSEDIVIGPGTKELMLINANCFPRAKFCFQLLAGFHISPKRLLLKIKFTGFKLLRNSQLVSNCRTTRK